MTTELSVPPTKHAESIAVVPRAMFAAMTPPFPQGSGLFAYSFEQWVQQAQEWVMIGQRKRLEKDPTYRQLLPYLMVTQVINGVKHYGLYQRTKRVGEERLGGKHSIGFGGHVDFADVVSIESVVQLGKTLMLAVAREKTEEVLEIHPENAEFTPVTTVTPSDLLILDDSDEVGKVHLGLVWEAAFPPDAVLGVKEDELVWVGMFPIEEILARSDIQLESWSYLLAQHLLSEAG